MKRNEHPLDEFFRSKLMDFEQSPSPYVWDRIQERQSSGKRKRLVFFLRASGIAAAIALAFLLGREWQAERTIRDNGSLADQSETFNQKQPVLDEVIQPAEPVVSSEDALAVMERSTSLRLCSQTIRRVVSFQLKGLELRPCYLPEVPN